MKNEYGITIEFLNELPFVKFEAEALWGESNLSDQRLGYYAYLLQQQNLPAHTDLLDEAMNDEYCLVKEQLGLKLGRIDDLEIKSVGNNWKRLDDYLKRVNEDENYRKLLMESKGDKYEQYIKEISDRSPYSGQPMDFELELYVRFANSHWQWIILRNAFMIKTLQQAKITSFDQLVSRCATFVYSKSQLNSRVVAFVKFEDEDVKLPE